MDFVLRVFSAKDEAVAEDVLKKWQETTAELFSRYFSNVDFSKFKEDVDPQEVIQLLIWAAEGYMHDRERAGVKISIDDLMDKFRIWTDLFKKAFYKKA